MAATRENLNLNPTGAPVGLSLCSASGKRMVGEWLRFTARDAGGMIRSSW